MPINTYHNLEMVLQIPRLIGLEVQGPVRSHRFAMRLHAFASSTQQIRSSLKRLLDAFGGFGFLETALP